jgi:hypothetical protein
MISGLCREEIGLLLSFFLILLKLTQRGVKTIPGSLAVLTHKSFLFWSEECILESVLRYLSDFACFFCI